MEIAVSDTGVGMAPNDIKKLFRIEKHHTTVGTDREQGTGLGLIICQEMILKNKGRIWIKSKYKKGTSVKFTLPLAPSVNIDTLENASQSTKPEIIQTNLNIIQGVDFYTTPQARTITFGVNVGL